MNTALTEFDHNPLHQEALDAMENFRTQVYYACTELGDPQTDDVRRWLYTYGIRSNRTYASKMVADWRRSQPAPADETGLKDLHDSLSDLEDGTMNGIVNGARRTIQIQPVQVVNTTAVSSTQELDAELVKDAKNVDRWRMALYASVLLVAAYEQTTGLMYYVGLPMIVAIIAVGVLEIGSVVMLASADVRRRLGENAILLRLIGAGITLGAATFNLVAHSGWEGALGSGMSVLALAAFWTRMEARRRDRLRALGQLPPTAPSFPLAQWLAHPFMTSKARTLAVTHGLTWNDALNVALLGRSIKAEVRADHTRRDADLAENVYSYALIAQSLREQADNHGMAAQIAERLAPKRLTGRGDAA